MGRAVFGLRQADAYEQLYLLYQRGVAVTGHIPRTIPSSSTAMHPSASSVPRARCRTFCHRPPLSHALMAALVKAVSGASPISSTLSYTSSALRQHPSLLSLLTILVRPGNENA